MEELALQLETLTQTVSTLLALHPDIARINTSRTKQALDTLSNTLQKAANTAQQPLTKPTPTQTPRTTTYAAAATKKPNTADHKITQPGRTQLSQPLRPVESKRLVVDFRGLLPTKDPAPSQIRDELNKFLNQRGFPDFKVVAAKRTNHKNIVLSITPPSAANALLRPGYRDFFMDHLKVVFGIKGHIDIYTDDKWHRVVVNKIPINGPGLPKKNIQEALVDIKSDFKAYNDVGLETRLDGFH